MSTANEAKLREALYMALCSYQGARERWPKFMETDPSDAELLDQIGMEFGSYGGFCGGGMMWHAHGGKNPIFEHTSDPRDRSVWKKKALVALAREVLGGGYVQKKLPFAEAV